MNKYIDAPSKSKSETRFETNRQGRFPFSAPNNGGREFTCAHCHYPVVTLPHISGVQNRNHCPFCLWSRHLDLYQAGDRLSACKAPMRPVALSLKLTPKKYASQQPGELMVVHLCAGCGKLSLNRLAADDDLDELFRIFETSFSLDGFLCQRLSESDIHPLTAGDQSLVRLRLLGQPAWR